MQGKLIETEDDVAEGAAWLAAQDRRFGQALSLTGPWPLRRRDDGFEALRDAILGQQVSVAAARSIRAKLLAAGRRFAALPGVDAAVAANQDPQLD